VLLPSRKTQLLAYSFRSQYRLRWNLALPEEDLSNRRQMDGPVLCARNFREGECSCRAAKLSCTLIRSARNTRSGGTSPSRKKIFPIGVRWMAPFCVRAIFGRASAPAEPKNSAARLFVPLAIPAQMELHAPGPGPFLPAKDGWRHFVARFVVLKNLAQRTAH
jgi:hypothetical protein